MIRKLILFIGLFLYFHTLVAQNLTKDEVELYTNECSDLVGYLEFSLNAIGDNELSPKEKDIIISESYLKLFRDDKVQIEDDLVADREAVTNKDVQAYLKDVDFFFQQVTFSYKILSVNLQQDEDDHEFFKIHALRSLYAVKLDGDSIYNEQARYIEVAIKPDLRELKIVSIYTTKLNEKEENIKWWNDLPISWKEILGHNKQLCDQIGFSNVLFIDNEFLVIEPPIDSLALSDVDQFYCDSLGMISDMGTIDTIYLKNDSLKAHYSDLIEKNLFQIINTKELDISTRLDINHIEPLSKLTELNSLNISGTLVNDLYPVRNLVHLQDLNISGTLVNNLDALIYSMSLQNLDISHSKVYTLEPLRNLQQIYSLNISLTTIDDLSPIASFKKLSDLKMQNTMVFDLEPIKNLTNLDYLYLDHSPINDLNSLGDMEELKILSANNTMISSLEPIHSLNNLNVLYCDNTEITSLKPLDHIESLSRVYCDNTLLGKKKALDFMNNNPEVLVVYESQMLQKWFQNLNDDWKQIFVEYAPEIEIDNPTKEQLHLIAGIPEMDLSNHSQIKNIEPLSQIQNLQKLNLSNTNISSVEPLYELRELKYLDLSFSMISNIGPLENNNSLQHLDISHTKVGGINALRNLYSLRKLFIDDTPIKNIEPLVKLNGLNLIHADDTEVPQQQFIEFIFEHPDCLVIYQSDKLLGWWNQLPEEWKMEFSRIQNWLKEPDYRQLHQLHAIRSIRINNNRSITSIEALKIFPILEELELSGTQISDLSPIKAFESLKKLNISQTPIVEFYYLSELQNLEYIDISNTQIDDIEWISDLTKLQYLDISGTQIKKTKALSNLQYLKTLIAFNTRINSLKDISELQALQTLKIYNTRISSKKVDQFKSEHPNCEVDYF